MSHWHKKIKYAFLVFLVKTLILAGSRMPGKWLHACFSLLAGLAFIVVGSVRRKTISNIRIGYPELSEKEAFAFAKKVFGQFGKNYADLVKGLSIRTKEQFRKVVRIDGEEHFQKAFEKGKGVLALNCHLGAFEFAGTYCGLHYPTVGVGAKLKNETLDRLLVEQRRNRGMDFVHRGEGALKILRSLKKGKVVMILIDQDTSKVKNVFVDFYGKKTATPIGAAVLALKTGAPVIPMAMSLQNGKQVLTIRPAVEIISTGDEENDISENTQRISRASEAFIKEHPEQWVWVHERWKSKPP